MHSESTKFQGLSESILNCLLPLPKEIPCIMDCFIFSINTLFVLPPSKQTVLKYPVISLARPPFNILYFKEFPSEIKGCNNKEGDCYTG